MTSSTSLRLRLDRIETPIGVLLLLQDADGRLRAIDWHDHEARMRRLLDRQYGAGRVVLEAGDGGGAVAASVRRYFAGDVHAIDALPVETAGTPFQRRVWRALREIPAGSTVTYGELARRLGQPTAFRAVGLANGANPVGVVVPCHRVVGADASLTGYGGGLERKRWLLAHEGVTLARTPAVAAVQARLL